MELARFTKQVGRLAQSRRWKDEGRVTAQWRWLCRL